MQAASSSSSSVSGAGSAAAVVAAGAGPAAAMAVTSMMTGSNDTQGAKRSCEPAWSEAPGSTQKRIREEDLIWKPEESSQCVTRLVVDRIAYSKIIGKAGQTMAHIRSSTGVGLRATELTDEAKLILLQGSFRQVVSAFDVVSELIRQAQTISSPGLELPKFTILIEPSKASHRFIGKIVGIQGNTVQSLRNRSGVYNIKIAATSMDVCGVSLRPIDVNGPLSAIRKFHGLFLELFVGEALAAAAMAAYPPLAPGGSLFPTLRPIEPEMLGNFGVPGELVHQIAALRHLLSTQFGLQLAVLKESGDHLRPSEPTNPNELIFTVPREAVGALIGKGGQTLKDVQAQFCVRIHIERDEEGVVRKVVIIAPPGEPDAITQARLRDCRLRLMEIAQLNSTS